MSEKKESITETCAKDILLDELDEQGHPAMVEDVIFWALEQYAENNTDKWGGVIAYSIVSRIKRAEQTTNDRERWAIEK